MKVSLYVKSLGLALMLVIFLAGCPMVEPEPDGDPTPTFNGTVFDDGFTAVAKESVDFWNGDNGFTIGDELSEKKEGNSSLFIDWTNVADWNGMAVGTKPAMEQNLGAYNALTFWARAAGDSTVTVDKIGFGAEEATTYELFLNNVALSSTWEKLILPIPDSSILTAVSNLFYAVDGAGGKVLVDDVKFEYLTGAISLTGSTMTIAPISVGSTGSPVISAPVYTYNGVKIANIGGDFLAYASKFMSSDTSVATVAADGTVTGVAEGTATINAEMGGLRLDADVTVSPPFTGVIYDDALQNGFIAMAASSTGTVSSDTAHATTIVGTGGTSIEIDIPTAPSGDGRYGGTFIENASGVNVLAFTNIKFALNTGTLMSPMRLEFKLEDTAATPGVYTTNILALAGGTDLGSDWTEYTVALIDATAAGVDFSNFKAVGFWNPTAAMTNTGDVLAGKFYIDNIRFE